MRHLLRNLAIESGFVEYSTELYNRKNSDCFIISEYTESELINYFKSDITRELISKYKENSEANHSFKKSTNLLIYVEVENVKNSLNKLKNTIFSIEEDEYFFRKFVFLYSNEMLETIEQSKKIKPQLQSIVEQGNVDNLRVDEFHDLGYYFALQLFIKIPWLSFGLKKTEFELLDTPLIKKLKAENLNDFDEVLNAVELEQLDELIDDCKAEKLDSNHFDKLIALFGEQG